MTISESNMRPWKSKLINAYIQSSGTRKYALLLLNLHIHSYVPCVTQTLINVILYNFGV